MRLPFSSRLRQRFKRWLLIRKARRIVAARKVDVIA